MNTNATIIEKLELPERRLVKEQNADTARKRNADSMAFTLVVSGVLILAAVAVLKVTGLYDGMESVAGKIGLVAVISTSYLIAFRRGFYTR